MIFIKLQLLLTILATFLNSFKIAEAGLIKNVKDTLDCGSVTCELDSKCKPGYELKQLDGFCCPTCVCKPCHQIDLDNLCSVGFELKEIPKKNDECCNSYKCLSIDENNLERLDINKNIRKNRDSLECTSYDCTHEKYTHLLNNANCPIDSIEILASEEEKFCCDVESLCICNKCSSETEMNDWCKVAGSNFKATMIEKGKRTPGNCCDVHICHSINFTCQYNGNVYPNNFEWMLNACTECKCELGYIKCSSIECPKLDCEVTRTLEGECCPVCTNQCFSMSLPEKVFEPMEKWYEYDDPCIQCKCLNGKKDCLTESCGPVDCPNPVKLLGVCCLSCPAKIKCTKDCNELLCEHGYEIDEDGCDTCKCYQPNFVTDINKTREKERSIAVYKAVLGLIIIMTLLLTSSILLICIYRSNSSSENSNKCSKLKSQIGNCKDKAALSQYAVERSENALMLDGNCQDSNSSLYDKNTNMSDFLSVKNQNSPVLNKAGQSKIGSICYL